MQIVMKIGGVFVHGTLRKKGAVVDVQMAEARMLISNGTAEEVKKTVKKKSTTQKKATSKR